MKLDIILDICTLSAIIMEFYGGKYNKINNRTDIYIYKSPVYSSLHQSHLSTTNSRLLSLSLSLSLSSKYSSSVTYYRADLFLIDSFIPDRKMSTYHLGIASLVLHQDSARISPDESPRRCTCQPKRLPGFASSI